MKTDIEIAQEAVMEPIGKVAEQIGIGEDDLEHRQEKEKQPQVLVWHRLFVKWEKKQSLHCVSRPLDHVLVLKVEQQVVDIHRLYRWKI